MDFYFDGLIGSSNLLDPRNSEKYDNNSGFFASFRGRNRFSQDFASKQPVATHFPEIQCTVCLESTDVLMFLTAMEE